MPKILIADPDVSSGYEFYDFLVKQADNPEITVCENVEDALNHLAKNRVDIVISDVFAPEPRCTEITEYCSSHAPDTRIILTSSHKVFSYARMAVRCRNVVDFIIKPPDKEYLLSVINNIFRELYSEQKTPYFHLFNSKQAEFFSDVVHGHITEPDVAREKLRELNLNIPTDSAPCSLMHFHIADFSSHIRSARQKDIEHFYEELASVIPFETEDAYISLASYSHGNISWFIVHKTKKKILADLDMISDYIRRTLFEKMSLNTTESSRRIWISLCDMMRIRKSEERENAQSANSIISEALIYMRKNYSGDLSLKTVADHVNVSPIYFSSYFKRHTGQNFVSKLTDIRIQQAAKLLITTDMPIREIKISVGYHHTGNFYNHFRERYGKTPNDYKEWYFGNQ